MDGAAVDRRAETVAAATGDASVDGDPSAGLGVDVGLLVAHSPSGDPPRLREFAGRVAGDIVDRLAAGTDVPWRFHAVEPDALSDGDARRPSEFLDEAARRMVEGPFDLLVVLTDVPLLSRRARPAEGLASPVSRVAVVSTQELRSARTGDQRGAPVRSLDDEAVRWNAATLLLHLLGHVLGARHGDADGGVMEPFEFDPSREDVPRFDGDVRRHLERIGRSVPEEEVTRRGTLRRLSFHALSAARNPRQVGRALVHSRAPLIPLSLPSLTTAAVTPTLILVFSAETWDVGINLDAPTAAMFAVVSVLAAALHLLFVLNLVYPRKRRQVLTEHMALVNVTVFLILVFAIVGLFALVAGLMLVIELFVFPQNLMENWPSLENPPPVGLVDLVRTAGFISTIGVLSGALAGGLENRTVVRHLALFLDRP